MDIPKEIDDILEDSILTSDEKVLKMQTLNSHLKKLETFFVQYKKPKDGEARVFFEEGKTLDTYVKEVEKTAVNSYLYERNEINALYQCFLFKKPGKLSITWDDN